MFGYDDKTLERIRRPRSRLRWVWRGAIALTMVLAVVFNIAAYYLLTPEGLAQLLPIAFKQGEFDVTVKNVAVAPSSRLLEPDTWKISYEGVEATNRSPDRPSFQISRVMLSMPDLWRVWSDKELVFPWSRVIGLDIQAPRQQKPEPFSPKKTPLSLISSDVVEVWDARWRAAPDPPLGEAYLRMIYGQLNDVAYLPGPRLLSGTADLTARDFRTGTLDLTRLAVPNILVNNSSLFLKGGHFDYAGVRCSVEGTIEDFHRGALVTLEVDLQGAEVSRVVENATGNHSPLSGLLDIHLVVHSGGDIPRGKGWMEGSARITNARIPLGPNTKRAHKDLIRVLPFLQLDHRERVVLGNMTGKMRLDRGSVDLHELIYQAPRRTLTVRGRIEETDLNLVLRAVPPRNPETRPGWGVVISGSKEKLRWRPAKKHELLPSLAPKKEDNGEKVGKREGIRGVFSLKKPSGPRANRRVERQQIREEKRSEREEQRAIELSEALAKDDSRSVGP